MRISDWSSDVCSSDLTPDKREVGGSTPPRPTILWLGALAQLGERLLCKHQVIGSIPISSTKVQMISGDEDSGLPALAGDMARSACFFDIVNGFFNRCRGDMGLVFAVFNDQGSGSFSYTNDYLAELTHPTEKNKQKKRR